VVICLERGANLLMAQLMPLPLTVSCFSKIQIGFTSLVPAHRGSPGKKVVKQVCVSRLEYDKKCTSFSHFVTYCFVLVDCLMLGGRCDWLGRVLT